MLWSDVEVIYAFGRMDDFFTEVERNWQVEATATDGAALWAYDWPSGRGAYPAIYNRDSRPPPPPASPPPSPPAVQRLNSPCESAEGGR